MDTALPREGSPSVGVGAEGRETLADTGQQIPQRLKKHVGWHETGTKSLLRTLVRNQSTKHRL